ncbi:MAG: MATE family efflux transporter [Bacteroidales bacterium]|nr:MATE family efflux transporter [Bacteroidales bacterium]
MKDLTQGKTGISIFLFALPMLLGNVLQQTYNIVDTYIIGQYIGKEALAAAGASFPVIFLLVSLVIGVTTGTTIIISQYFGAGNIEKVRQSIDTAMIFLFFASLALSILGLLLSNTIFRVLKLPDELIPMATLYFNIYAGSLVLMFGYNVTSAILRGLGDSKTPLFFLLISTILNIGLDLLFVIVFHWGIVGVALATAISQGVSFFLSVWYLNKYHQLIRFSFKGISFDRTIFRQSLRIGIPTGIQQTLVALGMLTLVGIVNQFGTNAIAAYTIVGRIDSIASMPAMNFSMALSTFVGQNIGANKIYRIKQGLISTIWMSFIVALIISIIAIFLGEYIVSAFTNEKEVIEIGKSYLTIVGMFYVAFTALFVFNGLLRGAGDTLIPMFITLISLWVLRIPASWLLSKQLGTDGIWWGIPIAWVVGLIISFFYYRTGNWKNKSVLHETYKKH